MGELELESVNSHDEVRVLTADIPVILNVPFVWDTRVNIGKTLV